jgi:Chaperone of endosialidase
MRQVRVACAVTLALLVCVVHLTAQSASPSASVPRLINLSGTFHPADGRPSAPVETVRLAIFSEEVGGSALWEETQTIQISGDGHYNVILGQTQGEGIPLRVFASTDERWLGMLWARLGEVEGPRTRITSVPYALRASDADTLGGRPASAFLLAPTGSDGSVRTADVKTISSPQSIAVSNVVLPGTPNFLAKYVNNADVGNSAVFENGGAVGIGTTAPVDVLHARFTNTAGTMTGLAVQNLGNTATSYSGMLFYDQNGALGQFQGFNNVTHEYRINNIAKNGANFDGTINFMTGSTSRLFVDSVGRVGINTTSPSSMLEADDTSAGVAILGISPGTAIYGYSPAGFAGYFNGKVHVFGDADVSGGFRVNSGVGVGTAAPLSGLTVDVGSGDSLYAHNVAGFAIHARSENTDAAYFEGSTHFTRWITLDELRTGGLAANQMCLNGSNQIATCSSSLRYKENVQAFTRGLDIVSRLRPITFDWKEGGSHDLGLAAEETSAVEPLLTFRNASGEIEGVKYGQLSAVFVNAFKEQQAQIDEQQELVAALNAENATLTKQNAALGARVTALEQAVHRILEASQAGGLGTRNID